MHRVTVLVASYSRRASFIYYKEKPEVDPAPAFADLKIVAISVLFRLVSAQSQGERRNKPEHGERQAPREREKIENRCRNFGVHSFSVLRVKGFLSKVLLPTFLRKKSGVLILRLEQTGFFD